MGKTAPITNILGFNGGAWNTANFIVPPTLKASESYVFAYIAKNNDYMQRGASAVAGNYAMVYTSGFPDIPDPFPYVGWTGTLNITALLCNSTIPSPKLVGSNLIGAAYRVSRRLL
jgi:hypothetical protein